MKTSDDNIEHEWSSNDAVYRVIHEPDENTGFKYVQLGLTPVYYKS